MVGHPGQHEAIVERPLWDEVQGRLADNGPDREDRPGKVEASPLAGKMFDQAGERLTPSHAVKNGRRYRYYISKPLVTGLAEQQQGWRLPAHEIERCVAGSVRAFVADPAATGAAIRDTGVAADRIPAVLEGMARWDGEPLDLVRRVDLATDGLGITLALDIPAGEPGLTVTRQIPMTIKRRGVEMRLVIDGAGPAAPKADPALLKAIARARGWFNDVITGRAASLTAIARRDGLTDSYVSHLLPLAFLAPDIVEAIAAGRHPADLTAEALVRRVDLPLGWDEQRALLNFA